MPLHDDIVDILIDKVRDYGYTGRIENFEDVICAVGDVYNETFENYFGDYRLSQTIIKLNDGEEPEWLADLHTAYDNCKERGDI